MTTDRTLVLDTKVFRTLGISESEERAYVALLTHHTAIADDIARELKIQRRAARQLLARIEAMGLATHTPQSPTVYIAAEPEFAINALIKQRQIALEQARAVVPVLAERFAHSTEDQQRRPVLELVTNREYLGLVVARMFKSFRSEIMSFMRAPVLVTSAHTEGDLPRGAHVRAVADNTYLDIPGSIRRLQGDVGRGEQVRTFSDLPFKMMIVDRSVAIITLDTQKSETAPTLLIQRSELLEALCVLFECVWEKAVPVLSVRRGKLELQRKDPRLAESTDALVSFLSAGLNDKAIAQELQVSASTLNRRIGDLMAAFGARTRFQLGMQVGISGCAQRTHPPTRKR